MSQSIGCFRLFVTTVVTSTGIYATFGTSSRSFCFPISVLVCSCCWNLFGSCSTTYGTCEGSFPFFCTSRLFGYCAFIPCMFFTPVRDFLCTSSITSGTFDIVNIGLHFFLKNVRPHAASCSEA